MPSKPTTTNLQEGVRRPADPVAESKSVRIVVTRKEKEFLAIASTDEDGELCSCVSPFSAKDAVDRAKESVKTTHSHAKAAGPDPTWDVVMPDQPYLPQASGPAPNDPNIAALRNPAIEPPITGEVHPRMKHGQPFIPRGPGKPLDTGLSKRGMATNPIPVPQGGLTSDPVPLSADSSRRGEVDELLPDGTVTTEHAESVVPPDPDHPHQASYDTVPGAPDSHTKPGHIHGVTQQTQDRADAESHADHDAGKKKHEKKSHNVEHGHHSSGQHHQAQHTAGAHTKPHTGSKSEPDNK